MQGQGRSSQETIVQPWGRVLVPPQGIQRTLSLSFLKNSEIRLIIFFAVEDGEVLYSQQKQDQKLTVAQIMSSLLPNSDVHRRK